MTFMSKDATLLDRELLPVVHARLSWLTILQVAILTQAENIRSNPDIHEVPCV
jgi:hypothetical protein